MHVNASGVSNFIDLDYEDDHPTIGSFYTAAMPTITIVVSAIVIFLGALFNLTAIVIAVRRRLWRAHEGHLYLLAIFVANCVIVSFTMFPHFLWLFPSHIQLEASSNFACKAWNFVLNVANSVGWIVDAMLANVYVHDLRKRGIRLACPKRVAERFCTTVGSVTTVVAISVCFALTNCWTLWATEVILLEGLKSGPEAYVYICDITENWLHIYYEWEIPSFWLKLFIPVVVLIPVEWSAVLWSRRKHDPGFAVFAFDRDAAEEDRDFARAALIVGAAVFLLQFPRVVTGIVNFSLYNLPFYVVHRFAHLLFNTHVVVVPLCCLLTVGRMRADFAALFRSRCCPAAFAVNADAAESDGNENLSLSSRSGVIRY